MKLHQSGDKTRAICPTCSRLSEATYLLRDVPFSDGLGAARDILACVCDQCGEVVAIPAQSTPSILAARSRGIERV